MSYSTQIKESIIQDYILKINFSGDFSIAKIKTDLKQMLLETPAIQVKYFKENIITEQNGKKVTTIDEKVSSIIIAFSDGDDVNGNPIVHKREYFI